MRVWIDLSNSPHPLLFAPISRRLANLGHQTLITARDNAQTAELARRRWPDVEVIGGPSPKAPAGKLGAIGERVLLLRRWARPLGLDVALSHNSYAQILAARAIGIRAVTAMDFEHQPLNHLAFRLANTVLLPNAIGPAVVRRQGARPGKVRWYPGIKEQAYVGDFERDPSVLERLGVKRDPGTVVVVTRTPPSRAIYHRHENLVYSATLQALVRQSHVRCVALLRHPEQRAAFATLDPPNIIIPEAVIEARALMSAADLVIGGGGTMTREAALLGVPTLSAFVGRRPAVDRWLENQGLLRSLVSVAQISVVRPRQSEPRSPAELRAQAEPVIDAFVRATLDGMAAR